MSLVICSNKGETRDGRLERSIFEPFSWRNDLSSTLTIPKNAQIGLHSAKIELDGMVETGRLVAFQYFGEVLNEDTETDMDKSSAYTMELDLGTGDKKTPETLATLIQKRMNDHIWHPNLVGKVSVSAKREAVTNTWQGFDITYDQNEGTATHIPGAGQVYDANWLGLNQDDALDRFNYPGGSIANLGWSYSVAGTEGTFLVEGDDVGERGDTCSMIASEFPISLMDGQLLVDITNVLTAGNDFVVGLTRVNADSEEHYEDEGIIAPTYFDKERGPDILQDEVYYDYALVRLGNNLHLQDIRGNTDATFDPGTDTDSTFFHEVEYWQNANVTDFAAIYDIGANALNIEKIKYTCNGQQIKIELIDDRDDAKLLFQYDSSYDKEQVLTPINQSTWSLVPLLAIQTTPTLAGPVSMKIVDYTPTKLVNDGLGYRMDRNAYSDFGEAGWWNYQSVFGKEYRGQEIETRAWNDLQYDDQLTYMRTPTSGTNRRLGKGTTGDSKFQNLLFVDDSDLYDETYVEGAVGEKLGFQKSPVEDFTEVGTAADSFGIKFSSEISPILYGSKSLFVKVGGLSQQTTNAFKGTPSTIIAHMPLFDGQATTGRLFYEPNEIAYIDLNNAYEFKISSLDIAFCYVDESFATPLTGQSVVLLHIRPHL